MCAEVTPYSSVGGLAQVARALSRALKKLNVDIRIFTPKYCMVDEEKYPTKKIISDLKVPSGDGRVIDCGVESVRLSTAFDVPVYFLTNDEYYKKRANVYNYSDDHIRFGLLSKAAIEFIKSGAFVPDIVHANDWHTGYLIDFLRNSVEYKDDARLQKIATILSIHNIFQGVFDFANANEMDQDDGKSPLEPLFSDKLMKQNSLKRGVMFADLVNTVSETYVQELLDAEYGGGLENLFRELRGKLFGVLNGLDTEELNPITDEVIKQKFNAKTIELRAENKLDLQKRFNLESNPEVPLLAYSGRLDQQKGLDLLVKEFEFMINDLGVQLIILGGGERSYVQFFSEMEKKYPGKVGTHLMRDFTLPRKIFAGADMILIPSKYEPGGIIAVEALRYGCIPIARATGGLADSVKNYDPKTDTGYGFTFKQFSSEGLLVAVVRAIETYKNPVVWKRIIKRAMQEDFSWKKSATKYVDLYEKVLEQHKANLSPETEKDSPLYS